MRATRLVSCVIMIEIIIIIIKVIRSRLLTQDCAQQSVSSSSSSWAVCTPYRPGGLFDHVPRRTLEQGCVLGNGFVASCGVPCGGDRLSPNSRSHRLCLPHTTVTPCPRRLMPFPFSPSSSKVSSARLHAIRYDPFAGYARKRLIIAAKRRHAQHERSLIRSALPLSI